MSKPKHEPKRSGKPPSRTKRDLRRKRQGSSGGFGAWLSARRIIFRFVLTLFVLLGAFELVLMTDLMKERAIPRYLEFCATVSGGVMLLLGEEVTVRGSVVTSPRYSVNIKRGCDAVQPTILFVAAVFASPVLFWPKLPGVLAGVLFLMVLNLVRVVSLFYTGVYWQEAFDIMHHDVWQAAFILISISLWAAWAVWAARLSMAPRSAHSGKTHASG